MEKTLDDVLITGLVAVNGLAGAGVISYGFYELANSVAPKIKEYAGLIGMYGAEYGIPTIAALTCLYLTEKAADAVWQSRRRSTIGGGGVNA